VIGERDVFQPARARGIDPRLQELERVRLHTMPLRVCVVVREKTDHWSPVTDRAPYGAVRNFCRMRSSG
jgi:hypothetical protein